MAVKHQLQIEIGPDGGISINVKGAKGDSCMELTKALEEELGIVANREYSSEYYEATEEVQSDVSVGDEE